MDYAEYVTRRPPSPPPLPPKHRPFTPSPSLSAAAARSPHPARPAAPLAAPTLSSRLHRRAVRDEYASLRREVAAARPAHLAQHRQEAVRIRLEDMLSRADAPSQRVLLLALAKCNARLDRLAAAARPVTEARVRMRVIEAKHLLGPRAPAPRAPVPPALRALHIRRDAVATLVDHIACALHDQVRIHYLLCALSARLASLRPALAALARADRPARPADREHPRTSFPPPASPPAKTVFPRRASRAAGSLERDFAPTYHSDRPAESPPRPNVLRSQRSLPRRSDTRRLPLVVRRALSYNSSPTPPPPPPDSSLTSAALPVEAASTSALLGRPNQQHTPPMLDAPDLEDPANGRSEPHLSLSDARRAWLLRSELAGSLVHRQREDGDSWEDESFPPVSPVSHCTATSEGSPCLEAHRLFGRASDGEVAFDQSVLVDIDSLCTEASSVLSSSRGLEMSDKPTRRGSVSSALFHVSLSSSPESLRSKTLGKLRLARMRIPAQIKKLWLEINELYGIVLTHGPHLLEEKIVTRASMATGILGPWNSRRGKSAGFRSSFQMATVEEAIRKVDGIVLWQQQLIVAIRRDFLEQRKALHDADEVISEAYLQLLDAQ